MSKQDILTNENKYDLLAGRVPLQLNRFLSHQFKEKAISLTREQWSVLAVLWKTDGCSQQVIANATNRDKPSVTRLIDNLAKDGFVERRSHVSDRRTNLIFLTEKGKTIEKEVMVVVNETIATATEGLTESQILAVRDAFQHIYDNIKKFENEK